MEWALNSFERRLVAAGHLGPARGASTAQSPIYQRLMQPLLLLSVQPASKGYQCERPLKAPFPGRPACGRWAAS